MTEPLNYLRSALPYLREIWLPLLSRQYPEEAHVIGELLEQAQKAVKFVLPVGGRIFNDKGKGLPEVPRLPFPLLAIEYRAASGDGIVGDVFGKDKTMVARKRIVLASQQEDRINVWGIVGGIPDHPEMWVITPYYATVIPTDEQLHEVPEIRLGLIDNNGVYPHIGIELHAIGRLAKLYAGAEWRKCAYYDLADEVAAVLELIEALTCSNVAHEALPVRKMNKAAGIRGALPFDEYRVLVITSPSEQGRRDGIHGMHRAPREHLRRGHIRRLATGYNIWINSCVVNAGVGNKVFKDYEVRAQ